MRAYIIKRTGKTIWQNMLIDRKFVIDDKDVLYVGNLFYRKKDANKYLDTFEHKKYFEVVGVTIDKSKKDNRKTKC